MIKLKQPGPGRPRGRAQTETIKQRKVEVYLPSVEERARWSQEAEKRGFPLSKLVFDVVSKALSPDEQERESRSKELAAQNSGLASELAAARQRINELESLTERLNRDLEEYRAEAFLDKAPIKKLDKRVHRILSEAKNVDGTHRPVSELELRRALHMTAKDELRLKALAKQLEVLEVHNIIRRTNKGWAWND